MQICPFPSYVYRKFEHDFPGYSGQAGRAARAILPFFTLYKPFSYPLALGAGGARLIVAGKELCSGERTFGKYAHAAAAAAGLAGTIFGHPLGMLVASVHDLAIDLRRLSESFQKGDIKEKALSLLEVTNELLYISLFLGAGRKALVLSLCTQVLLGMHRSWLHYQREEKWEAASHFGMSLIRGHQAIREAQAICIQEEIQKAKEEKRPYLPLANRVQTFFAYAGYRINVLARWTIRQSAYFLNPGQTAYSHAQTVAKIALAAPFMIPLFALSTPCYLIASYAGIGRLELLHGKNGSSEPVSKLHLLFQNICGQTPWSIFSGGELPAFEVGPDGKRRIDILLENILKERPDVYCGQEYDDWDISEYIAKALASQGYACLRDLGCNDPFFNHSGLFLAVLNKEAAASMNFIPMAPEHTSGITYWCNRAIMTVHIPMENGETLEIVNIHFNAGSTPQDQLSRLEQFREYIAPLMKQGPAIVVGDSNLDTSSLSKDQKEYAGLSGFINALEGLITCIDWGKHFYNGKPLKDCLECKEMIDVAISDPNKVAVSDVKIQPGGSDHHLISMIVEVLKRLSPLEF